jgi:hypothetical protein
VSRPLPALTVHQPWAWAICHAGKNLENRGWAPPPNVLGHHLAIHAGKHVDADAYARLQRDRPALWKRPPLPPPEEITLGAIVAVAKVVGAILVEGAVDGLNLDPVRTLGAVTMKQARDIVGSQWALGEWLWVLDEVVALPRPVPCRGAQKIWIVPEIDADEVREGWMAARRATT